jgi:hypothetical protein
MEVGENAFFISDILNPGECYFNSRVLNVHNVSYNFFSLFKKNQYMA